LKLFNVNLLKSESLEMSVHVLKMLAAGDDSVNVDAAPITFDMFWNAYPKRRARPVAERAWLKLHKEEYAIVMDSLREHRKTEDWRRDGGMYIPYPATFLNQKRWLDDLSTDVDVTMGQCCWNQHGTRENGPRCALPATKEKNGVVYCAAHAGRVN
jgi:hypothetical protein